MATSTVPPVFVYGSLMAPEVLNIVLNRIPRTTPAVLHGYARYRIKQRVYPAIVPSLATHRVDGLVCVAVCGAHTGGSIQECIGHHTRVHLLGQPLPYTHIHPHTQTHTVVAGPVIT